MARDTHLAGKALIQEYRRRYGDKTVLAFSRGKDSIGCHLAIRDHLDVTPVHYIIVPGLSFIDESLDHYERALFGGQHIVRLPHPSFYRHLNNYLFQTPGHAEVIEAAALADITYKDVHQMIVEQESLPTPILCANGVRAADSPQRRMALTNGGPIRASADAWWPIWDWNKAKLLDEIERAGISLPIDYLLFGRSFDGLDARFLVPLKQQRPADYKRLLEWYPLADVEVFRYERDQAA
jgi:hypothetical protein